MWIPSRVSSLVLHEMIAFPLTINLRLTDSERSSASTQSESDMRKDRDADARQEIHHSSPKVLL